MTLLIIVIAILAVAVFLLALGHRYQVTSGIGTVVTRIDGWTGKTESCDVSATNSGWDRPAPQPKWCAQLKARP
jgi:multidrug transporter EmrE-like cation transporter